MLVFKPFGTVLTFTLCLIAINGGLLVWAWMSSYGIVYENGPIENIQVLILGLAVVTYGLIISKQEGPAQTLAAIFCFLCVYLILKELDFRELKVVGPNNFYWVENKIPEQIRKFLKFISLLVLIVFLISRIRDIPSMVRAMISWPAWPLYLCFALLLLSQALEHPGFRNPDGLVEPELLQALAEFHRSQAIGKFREELIELNAYLVLFYAAQNSAVISCLINSCDKK